MIRLDDLQVFVHAALHGSFSAAARQLDLSPALASGAVQRLERALGHRLLLRTTRRMRLSEEGERYLPHAQAVLAALASGATALAETRAEIGGVIRLSAPSDLGRNRLLPLLDLFQAQHPRIHLQLRITDQMADFFREPLDAGVRYGMLADSSLVSLPLLPGNRRAACAAPAYLARHGRPSAPDELVGHNCLRYVMGEHTHERWDFHLPQGVRAVSVSGDRVSDDADIVRRWAVAGLGIAYKSRLDLAEDLASGRLVELFPPEYGEPAPLQMVCAHRSAITPALQALRRFLVEQLGAGESP